MEYKIVEEFLADIRKEFRGGNKKMVKVAELKKLEQGERIMKEFVQEFRKTAKRSKYKERLLVEEFKKEINGAIQQKLMKSEY